MPAEGWQATANSGPPPNKAEGFSSLRAVIFANGELRDREAALAALRPDDWLIAANGGSRHCLSLGLTPALIVGDLDSLPPEDLQNWLSAGVEIRRHPRRKDQTDLELAMQHVFERAPEAILVLGGMGARWDHSLANLLLCFHPRLGEVPCIFIEGDQSIFAVRGKTRIDGAPGDLVSLIPVGGDAIGVTSSGLEYPLQDGRLPFGTSLGVSNVLVRPPATLEVRQGEVIAIVTRVASAGGAA